MSNFLPRRLFSSLAPRLTSPLPRAQLALPSQPPLPNPTPPPTCAICASPTYDCDLCGAYGSDNVSAVKFVGGDLRREKHLELLKRWGI